jgi:hypothetical protein
LILDAVSEWKSKKGAAILAAGIALLLAAIAYWLRSDLASAIDSPYSHPLGGLGYQFWSGIGSDIGEVTIIGALFAVWSNHNCHIHRCWRLSWHPSKKYGGHVVCRHHHEDSGTDLLKEK